MNKKDKVKIILIIKSHKIYKNKFTTSLSTNVIFEETLRELVYDNTRSISTFYQQKII